jgi:hypothetical protein
MFHRAYANKLDIHTLYQMHRRIAMLSKIKPQIFHCCVNTCCTFTNNFSDLSSCPLCGEEHYNNGMPRSQFEYLPIIPRLQGFFESSSMINALSYHANHEHIPGQYSDIFDESQYQQLTAAGLIVEGINYPTRYFEKPTDIALGLISDGVQVWKKPLGGNATAWPFFCINYNI